MAGPVVILGVFVADAVWRAARLPRMGETVLGNAFSLGPGGKGSNQAVAAAKAGAETHLVTRLGRDAFAQIAETIWAEAGVRPAAIREGDTGAAFIFLQEGTGENAIIVAPGAAGLLSPADMDAQAALIGGAGLFVTQLEQPLPAARRALEIARAGGARTILNPAPAAPLPDDVLALCDIVTPNESEAEALTGLAVTDLAAAEAAARALLARGAGAAAITLGANGVLWHDGRETIHQPAFAAGPVVDTTGAGDAFNGALAAALADGRAIRDALRFACAGAGLSVTRPGAAASMASRAEIDALLERAV